MVLAGKNQQPDDAPAETKLADIPVSVLSGRAREANNESTESQPPAASTEYLQKHGEATLAPSSLPSIDNPPSSNSDAPSTSTKQAADQLDVKPVINERGSGLISAEELLSVWQRMIQVKIQSAYDSNAIKPCFLSF